MNRHYVPRFRRIRLARLVMSMAFAGTVALGSDSTIACDQCGSHTACDVGGCDVVEASCGFAENACDSGCHSPGNPFTETLDEITSGIGNVLGLRRGGKSSCDAGCDDACDAAFAQELMAPIHQTPMPSMPPATPIRTAPALPQVPPLSNTVPMITPGPTGSGARSAAPSGPTRIQPAIPPTGTELPNTQPSPSDNPGSIFDSLDDPFKDDEVRLRPTHRQIQTSGLQKSMLPAGFRNVFTPQSSTRRTGLASRPSLQQRRRRVSSPAAKTRGIQTVSHDRQAEPKLTPSPVAHPTLRPVQQSAGAQSVLARQGVKPRPDDYHPLVERITPSLAPAPRSSAPDQLGKDVVPVSGSEELQPMTTSRVLSPYRQTRR